MPRPRRSRRPVTRVLDLLGRRWALRALWELRDGPRTFRALRAACDDVSPSSLNQRLAELRVLGVGALGEDGYGLTPSGARLGRILLDLSRWSEDVLGDPRTKPPPPAAATRATVAGGVAAAVSTNATLRRAPSSPAATQRTRSRS